MNRSREEFEARGFVHLPRLLPPERVRAAREAADEVIRDAARAFGRCKDCDGVHQDFRDPHCGFSRRPFIQLFNVWNDHLVMRDLVFCAEVREAATALLGCDSVRLLMDQLLVKRPGDEETPPHVDAHHWPIAGRSCTFWMPLDDVGGDMGMVRFYPTSHRRRHGGAELGQQTDDTIGEFTRRWLAAEGFAPYRLPHGVMAGGVTVHDGWTAHDAEPNTSGTTRIVVIAHLVDARATLTSADGPLKRNHVEMCSWQPFPVGAELRFPGCPIL